MIYFEKEWQGIVLLVGGIGSLVGTFIYGKKQKQTDLNQKNEELLRRVKELNSGRNVVDGEAK